ncbi:MAG: hypothetical protein ABI581_10460, partial [Sediminibacterium sp.]
VLLLAGNGIGVYHVVVHKQTTKNAWNIPLDETLSQLKVLEQPGAEEVYFTHSPTFTYYLVESGKKTISFYNTLYFDPERIKAHTNTITTDATGYKNLTFLLTYRGKSISVEHYKEMLQAINVIKADSVRRIQIGSDADYKLKQKFFPDYPPFDVEIVKLYGVKNGFHALSAWEKDK